MNTTAEQLFHLIEKEAHVSGCGRGRKRLKEAGFEN